MSTICVTRLMMIMTSIFFQDVQLEDSTNFSVVTERSAATTIINFVLVNIDRQLDDTDWVLAKVKANVASNVDMSGEDK